MEKILNFRKLATGMRNKEGLEIQNIYRSGDVSQATSNDIGNLLNNDITNIIDLRNKGEISRQPALEHSLLKRIQIDVMNDAHQTDMTNFQPKDMYDFLVKLYKEDYVTTNGFKDEMDHILTLNGSPFLFHCTGGKDRTGITGMILMYLLDFTPEQIIQEYLTIDERIIKEIQNHLIENYANHLNLEVESEYIYKTASVSDELIQVYIKSLLNTYNTPEEYIKNKLELTEVDIQKLKKYYLK